MLIIAAIKGKFVIYNLSQAFCFTYDIPRGIPSMGCIYYHLGRTIFEYLRNIDKFSIFSPVKVFIRKFSAGYNSQLYPSGFLSWIFAYRNNFDNCFQANMVVFFFVKLTPYISGNRSERPCFINLTRKGFSTFSVKAKIKIK